MRLYYKPAENEIIRNFEFQQITYFNKIQLLNETFSTFCNCVEAAGKGYTFCGCKKLQSRGICNAGPNSHKYK